MPRYPTLNLNRNTRRLGQAPAPAAAASVSAGPIDPNNVLLGMPIWAILKRRVLALLAPPGNPIRMQIFGAGWPNTLLPLTGDRWTPNSTIATQGGYVPFPDAIGQVTGWTPDQIRPWMVVGPSPTPDEVADINQVDLFFGPFSTFTPVEKSTEDPWFAKPCRDGGFHEQDTFGVGEKPPSDRGSFVKLDGAWCSPWTAQDNLNSGVSDFVGSVAVYQYTTVRNLSLGNAPATLRMEFWDIGPGETWGNVKPFMPNLVLADQVAAKYPFPAPFRTDFPWIWAMFNLTAFQAFVKIPQALTEDDIRVWITLSTLGQFNAMGAKLDEVLKSQAREAKRDAIRIAVAAVALGVLGALAALPAIVIGVTKAALAAYTAVNAAELAKNLASISDSFKSTDPGFAAEVTNASSYISRIQKALADGQPLDQARQGAAAISTPVLVGGAIAAAAGAALLLFRR
jgi:hypothetical protein